MFYIKIIFNTDIKVLSRDASNISFAKFVELRLSNFAGDPVEQTSNKSSASLEETAIRQPFKQYQYFLHKLVMFLILTVNRNF